MVLVVVLLATVSKQSLMISSDSKVENTGSSKASNLPSWILGLMEFTKSLSRDSLNIISR